MKKSVISSMFVMFSLSAHAAKYDCKLSNGTANDPKAITYQFDTSTEDNKFVEMGQGTSVGCVVLRTQPQLLTCGLGNVENFSLFVTAEDGSAVVSLETVSQGGKSNLTCVKKP